MWERVRKWWRNSLFLYENKLMLFAAFAIFVFIVGLGSELAVNGFSKTFLILGLLSQLIYVLYLFYFPAKKKVIKHSRFIAAIGIILAYSIILKSGSGFIPLTKHWCFSTGLMLSLFGGLQLIQALLSHSSRDRYFTIANISGIYLIVLSNSAFENLFNSLAMSSIGAFILLALINIIRGISIFANLSILGKARAETIFNSIWIGIIADIFLQFAEIWLFLALVPISWIGYLRANSETRAMGIEVCKSRCYEWVKPTILFSLIGLFFLILDSIFSNTIANADVFLVFMVLGYLLLALSYLSVKYIFYAILFPTVFFYILRKFNLITEMFVANPLGDTIQFYILFSLFSLILLMVILLLIKKWSAAKQSLKSVGLTTIVLIISLAVFT